MLIVEIVERRLLKDVAYERLRGAIVDGTLEPGSALRDGELAQRLGVSRGPVRDALARLAAEGLVESKPQSYTRVTEVVLKEVADAAIVVRAMHDVAVRAAAAEVRDEHVAAMRAANMRFAAAVSGGDVGAAMAADDELHGVLVDVCGNGAVAATIERYTPLIRRLERHQFGTTHGGQRSVRLHEALIEACAAHDSQAASEINFAIWSSLTEMCDAAATAQPGRPTTAAGTAPSTSPS